MDRHPPFLPNTHEPNDGLAAFGAAEDRSVSALLCTAKLYWSSLLRQRVGYAMTRDAAITAERFEEILAWLNADREIAGAMYVQLREDLAKVFAWRGCSDPEELTDEVFDRVATKVHQISDSYIGDPRFYFYGVAKNLIKENVKKSNTHISLKDVNDLSQPEIHEDELEEQKSLREKLFNECLKELSPTDRQLVLTYYQRDKRDAEKLAAQLGISQVNLRVRIHRIRQSLRRKLIRKMETNYQAK